jgi:hypothetical protein
MRIPLPIRLFPSAAQRFGLRRSIAVLLVMLLGLTAMPSDAWSATSSATSQDLPQAAMFIPKQAPLAASLLTSPDRLPPEALGQLQSALLADPELDFKRDIAPWIGAELTFAITTPDLDRDRSNGLQPGYLVAIATQQPDLAKAFMQQFWQRRALSGSDLSFEQYKGVKLIYTEASKMMPPRQVRQPSPTRTGAPRKKSSAPQPVLLPARDLASAVVGDRFLLFANHPKVIKDALTTTQAVGLSLADASYYQQALATLPKTEWGLAFVNVPRLGEWLSETAVTTQATTSGSAPRQTLAVALDLAKGAKPGIVAQTALISRDRLSEDSNPAALTAPAGAMAYIPSSAPLVFAGADLGGAWKSVSQTVSGYGTVEQLLQQALSGVEQRWHVDIPRQILTWMQGEYAIAQVPSGDPNQPVDWLLVAQRSGERAEQGLKDLAAIAQQQGLSLGEIRLGDQPVSAWTRLSTATNPVPASTKASAKPNRKGQSAPPASQLSLQAEVVGVRASVGPYELFATSLNALDQALRTGAPADTGNKTASPSRITPALQTAIAPLNPNNNGYLYLNWSGGKGLFEQEWPLLRAFEVGAQPLLQRLEAIAVSSYGVDQGVERGGVFLQLK